MFRRLLGISRAPKAETLVRTACGGARPLEKILKDTRERNRRSVMRFESRQQEMANVRRNLEETVKEAAKITDSDNGKG